MKPVIDGDVLWVENCRLAREEHIETLMFELLDAAVNGGVHRPVMNGSSTGCCGAGSGYATVHPEQATRLAQECVIDGPDIPVVSLGVCAQHLAKSAHERQVLSWFEIVVKALAQA